MSSENDPLATYLHDHLAGAKHAIDFIHATREEFKGINLSVRGSFTSGKIKLNSRTRRHLSRDFFLRSHANI
jgi:hypothetical protein